MTRRYGNVLLAAVFVVVLLAVAVPPANADDTPVLFRPPGTELRPRLIRSMEAVYVIDRGKRRWIVSPQVFTDYRFREEWIEQIPDDDLNRIGLGPDLVAGPVLRGADGRMWIVYQGSRHVVVADDAFPPLALSRSDVVDATTDVLDSYPVARPFGNQVRTWPVITYLLTVAFAVIYAVRTAHLSPRHGLAGMDMFGWAGLLAVGGVMVALRTYFVTLYPWLPDGADSQAYSGAALHLVRGNSIFSEDKYRSFIGVTSPLYPLVLWLISPALWFTNGNVVGWKLAQVALSVVLAAYTGVLGTRVANAQIGRVAAMTSLCSPVWFYSAEPIQYELVFALLLVMGVVHFLAYQDEASPSSLAASSASWGFALVCQLKAVVVVGSFGAMLAWQAFRSRKRSGLRITAHRWVMVLIFSVLATSPTILWGFRNVITHGEFIVGSIGSGVVLWMGNQARATGGIMGPSRPERYDEVAARYSGDQSVLKETRIYYELAIREIISNPSRILYLAMIKFDRFWWALYPERLADRLEARVNVFSGNLVDPFLVRALSMAVNTVTIGFSIYGVIAGFRMGEQQSRFRFALVATIMLFCLVHLPFLSEPRYRVPVLPFMEVLSVIGLARAVARFRAAGPYHPIDVPEHA